MAGEKELACILYGINIEFTLNEIEDIALQLERTGVTAGDLLWDIMGTHLDTLEDNLNNAMKCGVNPETATETLDGRSAAEELMALETAIQSKDPDRAFRAAMNIQTGVSRQAGAGHAAMPASGTEM